MYDRINFVYYLLQLHFSIEYGIVLSACLFYTCNCYNVITSVIPHVRGFAFMIQNHFSAQRKGKSLQAFW